MAGFSGSDQTMAAKAMKEIWVCDPLFWVGTAGVGCGFCTGLAAQQGMPQSVAMHLVQTPTEAAGADRGAKGNPNSIKLNIMENSRFI